VDYYVITLAPKRLWTNKIYGVTSLSTVFFVSAAVRTHTICKYHCDARWNFKPNISFSLAAVSTDTSRYALRLLKESLESRFHSVCRLWTVQTPWRGSIEESSLLSATAFLRRFCQITSVSHFFGFRNSDFLHSKVVHPQTLGTRSLYLCPQWQGGPFIPPDAGFTFHRLRRLAGLQCRYSNARHTGTLDMRNRQ
jgi:hypothetical protein